MMTTYLRLIFGCSQNSASAAFSQRRFISGWDDLSLLPERSFRRPFSFGVSSPRRFLANSHAPFTWGEYSGLSFLKDTSAQLGGSDDDGPGDAAKERQKRKPKPNGSVQDNCPEQTNDDAGQARDKVAKAFGVSGGSVDRARVRGNGWSDSDARVSKGDLTRVSPSDAANDPFTAAGFRVMGARLAEMAEKPS